MNCLSKIFTDEGLLQIKDGLTVNKPGIFRIETEMKPEILRMFVNLTARLGVELAAFEFPLTGTEARDAVSIRICRNVPQGQCQITLERGGIGVRGSSIEDLSAGVAYLVGGYPAFGGGQSLDGYLKEEGLQCIISMTVDTKTRSLKNFTALSEGREINISVEKPQDAAWGSRKSYDNAKKHFQQNLDVRILVDQNAAACPEAVLCTALRIALENYETVFPYGVAQLPQTGRSVRFLLRDGAGEIKHTEDGLIFSGRTTELTSLAYGYSREEKDPFKAPILKELGDILSCRNEVGQALETICFCSGRKTFDKTLITREYTKSMVSRQALAGFLSEKTGVTELKNFNDGKKIYGDTYRCSWEGKDFMDVFRNEVLPLVEKGDRVRLIGRLSEDSDIRRELEKEVYQSLSECGAASVEAEILRSFKSGYSWIEERVLPKLQHAGKEDAVASVEIRFPYLLNERGDDTFEDESTPNYGKHMDDPLKFFDIPTRWLQELFPVDELIAEKLGISTDAVAFTRNDNQGHTYEISCYDADGEVLYEDDFDVKFTQKHYIEKYPQIGLTHVTTGYIAAEINGVQVFEKNLKTDPEKVWDILETKIIPKLESYLTERYDVQGLVAAQPLFNKLQIRICMSEMDFDLGYREERISTAEAMQEDMYFYLLDWFKTYGERECGHELDNVGLIMPEPEICKGEETLVEVSLFDDLAPGAQLVFGEESMPLKEKSVSVLATSLRFEQGELCLNLTSDDFAAAEKIKLLNQMTEDGVIDFYQKRPIHLYMEASGRREGLHILKRKPKPSTLTEAEKNRLLDCEVLDYEQYLDLLAYYEEKPCVQIEPVETTYKGRKIFSVNCIKRDEHLCYGFNKLRSERLSTAFTARHHGNESSSMNSTFRLLEYLLKEEKPLMDKVNFILVPFINIDGGMLHCEVQRKHPKWLCHPARYNSAGFEFRKDFNNPNSIYGEARLLGKLWKEYLFDIITDNHGFEGHELCQPFSGYISPWYKSFWVPRAFYYGYIWYNGDAAHMVETGSRIRRKVVDAINGDLEIHDLNLTFAERFYKYAEKWFPDLFKLDRFEDVVFYWIDTREKPRAANYGVTNPEITAIDWTTEVADETAVGDYMTTNVRAHHISDLAVLEVLKECPLQRDSAVSSSSAGDVFVKFRRHPIFSETE